MWLPPPLATSDHKCSCPACGVPRLGTPGCCFPFYRFKQCQRRVRILEKKKYRDRTLTQPMSAWVHIVPSTALSPRTHIKLTQTAECSSSSPAARHRSSHVQAHTHTHAEHSLGSQAHLWILARTGTSSLSVQHPQPCFSCPCSVVLHSAYLC